jgi:hypothetical protein
MLKTKVKLMSILSLIQDSIAKSSFKKELLKIFLIRKEDGMFIMKRKKLQFLL